MQKDYIPSPNRDAAEPIPRKSREFFLLRGYRRLRSTFLAGPDWVEPPGYVVIVGYKSRTMVTGLWLQALSERFATFPGRMLLATAVFVLLCFPLAVNTPVRLLTIALFAFLAVDFVMGFVWRPRLSVVRRVPERIGCGGRLDLEYAAKNRGRLSAWSLEFDPNLPPKGLAWTAGPASLQRLPAGQSATVRASLLAIRRGKYQLPSILTGSAFPFGVFQWTNRQEHTSQTLLVHPAYRPLRSLSLPVGRKFQRHGTTLVSKVGESPDFIGCRDFRSGDDPRRIHWPSSAKRGDLIVKEFQEEYLSRIAVVLDTFTPPKTLRRRLFSHAGESSPELEAAVSLTASLADYLARGDYIVDIFAAGPEVYHFQGGRSLGYFENMLDILSCVEGNRSEPMGVLSPVVMEQISDIGCATVVLIHWSETVAKFVAELRQSGTAVKLIMVASAAIEGAAPDVQRLSPVDIIEGRLAEL